MVPKACLTRTWRLSKGLMTLFARVLATGFLPCERITSLNPASLKRVIAALREQRLAIRACSDFAALLKGPRRNLDKLTAERMEAAVAQLIHTLGQSPLPASEWAAMHAVFGDESLARLPGISQASLRRCASRGRQTPQAVAERQHWIARVVAT
jgi:hypothetical protein